MSIKSVLLIISGSIAAYKSLELIRNLRKKDIDVTAILTKAGQEFITPLAVSSLTGNETYTDLFSLKDEVEMGHIQLSRMADAILVAPATADIIAKMSAGICDDLATTTLLATDKPIYIAPAMNHRMWSNASTQRNIEQLQKDGISIIEPTTGEMACGEFGIGRMAEIEDISNSLLELSCEASRPSEPSAQEVARHGRSPVPDTGDNSRDSGRNKLKGLKALVTAGPTHEPVDPVRYIGNHSSGKQGIAIATALANAGASVDLVLGPVSATPPSNVTIHNVTTAQEMFEKTKELLPTDIAICAAAVADWRVDVASDKLKKTDGKAPTLTFQENQDILKWLSKEAKQRPELVIGFAAETEELEKNANKKLNKKGCDWLLANDVSSGKVFGKDKTQILFLPESENWHGSKTEIAYKLTDKISEHFSELKTQKESA